MSSVALHRDVSTLPGCMGRTGFLSPLLQLSFCRNTKMPQRVSLCSYYPRDQLSFLYSTVLWQAPWTGPIPCSQATLRLYIRSTCVTKAKKSHKELRSQRGWILSREVAAMGSVCRTLPLLHAYRLGTHPACQKV